MNKSIMWVLQYVGLFTFVFLPWAWIMRQVRIDTVELRWEGVFWFYFAWAFVTMLWALAKVVNLLNKE